MMTDNDLIMPISKGALRGFLFGSYDAESFRKQISHFDAIFHSEACRIIKDFGATKTAVVTLDLGNGEEPFFLKKYSVKGLLSPLLEAFRQSKAFQSWATSLKFLEYGIPCPKPVALLEERQGPFLKNAYGLFLFLENAVNLKGYSNRTGTTFLSNGLLLKKLGRIIGMMHHSNIVHGDLKWSNILIQDMEREQIPIIVDLDHVKISHSLNHTQCTKDLARFMVDVYEAGLDARLSDLFLSSYFAAAMTPDDKREEFQKQMEPVIDKIIKRHKKNEL